jgi:hypothetical protein
MDMQKAYVARMDAQIRAADARLDQLEARARASNAKAEMDEVSGLRARRDELRRELTAAKQGAQENWDTARRRMDDTWTAFRRDVADKHGRLVAWDDARERRLVAHLDEAEAALRQSAAADREVAADARVEIAKAQQELRDSVTAARGSYDAWRTRKKADDLTRRLDDAEFELDEASMRYTAALADVRQAT